VTRVLVLTAVDLEARGLARHLGLARVASSAWPLFAAGSVELAAVGVRAGELPARAAMFRAPDLVISAGACGALSPSLVEGELVVPEAVAGPDGARMATSTVAGLPRRGTLLSVEAVVESAAAKARLWMETGALAVDMESAAILAWARARGVAALAVRGVSDTAARGVPADLAAVVADDGRIRPMRAMAAALARPRAIADAMALRTGTEAALRTVAQALATVTRTV
jgi:adenosylhomocysteine nucleosidase